MTDPSERPLHISEAEWEEAEVPEWTEAAFAQARPFKEAHPQAYTTWKRERGRPRLSAPKSSMNFRFAADLVEGIKATGKGYNTRVERLLREALARGELDTDAARGA